MDLGLAGRTALVTGASRGIGKAIALKLAEEGCGLHLAARDPAILDQARSEIGSKANVPITLHCFDLMESGAPEKLAGLCADVDILINNAGSTPTGPIEEASEERWREGLELKVIATVLLTRALYLHMC